ncbi:MAG: efflux RND transporter periplasmic adaptor subunit [Clostridia bacterium]|nr:efflux RND transporter periplasmic adaptor subunit [Clostridia bacterium]
MNMNMKKKLIIGAVICAAVFLIFVLFNTYSSDKNKEGQEAEAAKPVDVETVRPRNLVVKAELSAQIKPRKEIQVVPEISGKVASVNVSRGQRVTKGQLLVSLERDELEAQYNQAQAVHKKAVAAYSTTESQIVQAESGFKIASARFENAEKDYKRMKTLYEQGVISQKDFDAIKAQYQMAESELAAAEKQLETAKKTAYELAKADIEQAEASLNLARHRLESSNITSPIDGIVAEVNVDPGEMAAMGTPVVTVVDMDSVLATAKVTEKYLKSIKEGQTVEVLIETVMDRPFKGKVVHISPVADAKSANTYELEVEISNKDHQIRPGMSAMVSLVLDKAEEVPAVPVDSVIERSGKNIVFVVEGKKAVVREVALGINDDKYVEIKKGLKRGDRVVVKGQHILNDGDRVILENGGRNK